MTRPETWTDARVAMLKGLWPTTASVTAIANMLNDLEGKKITRNSVVGKASRLELQRRRDPHAYQNPNPRRAERDS